MRVKEDEREEVIPVWVEPYFSFFSQSSSLCFLFLSTTDLPERKVQQAETSLSL